jgi:hypothetical protein
VDPNGLERLFKTFDIGILHVSLFLAEAQSPPRAGVGRGSMPFARQRGALEAVSW